MIDLEKIRGLKFPVKEFSYTSRDTILYALSVGLGRLLPRDLNFVYESNLRALPSLATVIAWDTSWMDDVGLETALVVHGQQAMTIYRTLKPEGRIKAHFRITDIFDKGQGRGAIILTETILKDVDFGHELATLVSTVFAKGDGGFGGQNGRAPDPHDLPQRKADHVAVLESRPEQAALYRLNGDLNPLHIDHAAALKAGFDKPIIHGLCTWGGVAGEIVTSVCSGDPALLAHFEARFTAPAFAGEPLVIELWRDAEVVSFRAHAAHRGVVVLDHGKALLRPLPGTIAG